MQSCNAPQTHWPATGGAGESDRNLRKHETAAAQVASSSRFGGELRPPKPSSRLFLHGRLTVHAGQRFGRLNRIKSEPWSCYVAPTGTRPRLLR